MLNRNLFYAATAGKTSKGHIPSDFLPPPELPLFICVDSFDNDNVDVITEDNDVRWVDCGAVSAACDCSSQFVLSRLRSHQRRPRLTQSTHPTTTCRLWSKREPRDQQKVCTRYGIRTVNVTETFSVVSKRLDWSNMSVCLSMCLYVRLSVWSVVTMTWQTSWAVIRRTPKRSSISNVISTLSVILCREEHC